MMRLVSVRKVFEYDAFCGIAANYVVEPSGITLQLFIPAKAWDVAQLCDDDLVNEIRERVDKIRVM